VSCYLFYFMQQLICHLLSAVHPCMLCYLKVAQGAAPLPPLVCLKNPALSAACPFYFLVYYSIFFSFFLLLQGRDWSVYMVTLVYPRGGCANAVCCLLAHLLVCVSQAGLELVSGSVAALLFFQCNVTWRGFVPAGGSGCWSLSYSWWVFFFIFCQVWLQLLRKIFDPWSSRCLFPPSGHHLGSPRFKLLKT
jgi:hypothetical protein